MGKGILIGFCMLGMVLGTHAQGTDAAYAKQLKSLYKGTVKLVSPTELAYMLTGNQSPLVMDTRTPREFEVSHIPGAHFAEYAKFDKAMVKDWPRSRAVVVYCTVGYRSERIGEQLKALGFHHVYNLYGGIFEWVNQGHPVVDSNGKPTVQVHAYSEEWGKWLQKGEKVYQ